MGRDRLILVDRSETLLMQSCAASRTSLTGLTAAMVLISPTVESSRLDRSSKGTKSPFSEALPVRFSMAARLLPASDKAALQLLSMTWDLALTTTLLARNWSIAVFGSTDA